MRKAFSIIILLLVSVGLFASVGYTESIDAFVDLFSEVIADGETTTIDDWSLDHVDRNDSEDVSAFVAVYKSASAKDVQYEDGCEVHLQVDPCPKWGLPQIGASFRANSTKKMPWDNLALWDDGFSFEQL